MTDLKNKSSAAQKQMVHALDWYAYDEQHSQNYSQNSKNKERTWSPSYCYTIIGFGISEESGSRVAFSVSDFRPYFFIELPGEVSDTDAFLLLLRETLDKHRNLGGDLVGCEVCYRMRFYGYQFGRQTPFAKLSFSSERAMRAMGSALLEQSVDCTGIFANDDVDTFVQYYERLKVDGNIPVHLYRNSSAKAFFFPLFESNLAPLLRFFHERDIEPSGWVELTLRRGSDSWVSPAEKGGGTLSKKLGCTCPNTIISCNAIRGDTSGVQRAAPGFVVMSFDIEASSSHGDFPAARKDYRKLGAELFAKTLQEKKNSEARGEKRCVFPVYKWLRHVFSPPSDRGGTGVSGLSRIYTKDGVVPTEEALLRFSSQFETDLVELMSKRHEACSAEWKKWREAFIAKVASLAEASFSHADCKFKTLLPKIEGDKVIQIGSVFWRMGESAPYRKHVVTLNSCDPIPGVDVEWCQSEADVLRTWKTLVSFEQPDVIVGYNITGFDWKFLWERADELNLARLGLTGRNDYCRDDRPLERLGKLQEVPCRLEEKDLNSAGFGDNKSYTVTMPGTVNIDLMKVVMRSHKLDSYKLDNVAANFINGGALRLRVIQCPSSGSLFLAIETDNLFALSVGDFIVLYNADSVLKDALFDGKKLCIRHVCGTAAEGASAELAALAQAAFLEDDIPAAKYVVVDFSADLNADLGAACEALSVDGRAPRLAWGVAKDDVTPEDIFRMQNEGSAERAVIAKYCVQDCQLVLNLMIKLDTLTNNMGMSNVCSVPLQYIFSRGESIKTFSTVSKECRANGYLIPTQTPPRDPTSFGTTNRNKWNGGKKTIKMSSPWMYEDMEYEMSGDDWWTEMGSKLRNRSLQDNSGEYSDDESVDSDTGGVSAAATHGGDHSTQSGSLPAAFARMAVSSSSPADPGNDARSDNIAATTTAADAAADAPADESAAAKEVITQGYEGAVVLTAHRNIYQDPIAVLDYQSLYPMSIISRNLSHCSIVLDTQYLGDDGAERLRALGVSFLDVQYESFVYVQRGKTKKKYRADPPYKTCRFVQPQIDASTGLEVNETRGMIPRTLKKLLDMRKAMKKLMKTEKDPFRRNVLDGLQNAYKVTANSVYGSIGAQVSPVHLRDIAACTTATGRYMLHMARDFVIENYPGTQVVYGDTDSIFVKFPMPEGVQGEDAVRLAISLGEEASERIRPVLPRPHNLEYEKVYYPFLLFSKKRYLGNKYETDARVCSLNYMGIVLRRRDNAGVLKVIYGAVIDRILNHRDVPGSITVLQQQLANLINGQFPLKYLVISKALKSAYDNPERITHKVLADRVEERGEAKFMPNDRVQYMFIEVPPGHTSKLQGDRVETPEFIQKHGLKIDFEYYIKKQIVKPVSQIFCLVVEDLPGFCTGVRRRGYFERRRAELLAKEEYRENPEKLEKKLDQERLTIVSDLLFKDTLDRLENARKGQPDIRNFFTGSFF